MRDSINVSVSNHGVSGETSAQIKARAPYTEGFNFSIILAGTNDLQRSEAERIVANLFEIYRLFEENKTTVVAVSIPSVRMVALLFVKDLI